MSAASDSRGVDAQSVSASRVVDARGLLCPMPIVRANQALRRLEAGDVLKILATDRGSVTDIPAWAADTGNQLLEWHEERGTYVYYVLKHGWLDVR